MFHFYLFIVIYLRKSVMTTCVQCCLNKDPWPPRRALRLSLCEEKASVLELAAMAAAARPPATVPRGWVGVLELEVMSSAVCPPAAIAWGQGRHARARGHGRHGAHLPPLSRWEKVGVLKLVTMAAAARPPTDAQPSRHCSAFAPHDKTDERRPPREKTEPRWVRSVR
jgi:hypothetical protein